MAIITSLPDTFFHSAPNYFIVRSNTEEQELVYGPFTKVDVSGNHYMIINIIQKTTPSTVVTYNGYVAALGDSLPASPTFSFTVTGDADHTEEILINYIAVGAKIFKLAAINDTSGINTYIDNLICQVRVTT